MFGSLEDIDRLLMPPPSRVYQADSPEMSNAQKRGLIELSMPLVDESGPLYEPREEQQKHGMCRRKVLAMILSHLRPAMAVAASQTLPQVKSANHAYMQQNRLDSVISLAMALSSCVLKRLSLLYRYQ
jgi:hypothetical protein